ncbi:MAG: bifunctional 5,10-methylenetetrahydrofolate dehydrogenase/5,10-methenyltetrahydrofolate cyclohydrolase [Candidatus Staskawiczbacteria bacterium]|jgi:methylenetetrahydrofolate dehydrogenase (NADP+)/methenyltetrahydrofolate cyclohydrolase
MIILDGKKLSEEILNEIKKEFLTRNQKMRLDIILVGDNYSSEVFARRKGMACSFIGIDFSLHRLPKDISIIEFKKTVEGISRDPCVFGIVIQLPLPAEINKQEVFDLIPPNKDVDILSTYNLGKFYTGNPSFIPPVVGAVSHFFKKYKITLEKKNVVLVGAGRLVGFPLSLWLFRKKATVSIVNEFTKDISFYTKKADIIISGVGKPKFIKGNMVKKGVIVIDVGVSLVGKKLFGDFDFETISKKARYITPVPGGVGPMTIACLLENFVVLNRDR